MNDVTVPSAVNDRKLPRLLTEVFHNREIRTRILKYPQLPRLEKTARVCPKINRVPLLTAFRITACVIFLTACVANRDLMNRDSLSSVYNRGCS